MLRILRKGGPNKARARRLGSTDNPAGSGPIACAKRLLANLNIPWVMREDGSDAIAIRDQELPVGEEAEDKILHALRDKLRRREWREASERRPDMAGKEQMDYEKTVRLWRPNELNDHQQRIL